MIINVVQEHIDRGVPEDAACCPIALAIQSLRPGKFIEVSEKDVLISNMNLDEYYCLNVPLPESARQFVEDFDNNRPVSPFSFELDLSHESPY